MDAEIPEVSVNKAYVKAAGILCYTLVCAVVTLG